MTPLLVGIDAGASHTEAVLGEAPTQVMDRWRGGPGVLRPDVESEAVKVWLGAIAQVLERFGDRSERVAVAVGAAGAGDDTARRRAEALLGEALGRRARVTVTTDGDIALEAAFPERRPGIVVMAGSGSIAHARTTQGTVRRAGGLGWVMGDEGSGYALTRAALQCVGRAADGRSPTTALTDALVQSVEASSVRDLVRWTLDASPRDVAALAPVVCGAADAGDAVAEELVDEAAIDLLGLVDALRPAVPTEGAGVALGGGLLRGGSPVRARLVQLVGEQHPDLRVLTDPVDPPLGALRLAGGM